MARAIKEALPEKENVTLERPSKLSSLENRRIVSISNLPLERLIMLFQATHLINSALSSPISSQNVRHILKATSSKAVVQKKKPLVSATHRKRRLEFALKYKQGLNFGGLDQSSWVRWKDVCVEKGR